MNELNPEYEKPLLFQIPKYCRDDTCELKDECLRFQNKGMYFGIDAWACKRSDHCFIIRANTPEGNEFERQESLYLKELGPFSLDWSREKIPTDDSMYDCYFCKKAGLEHRIESHPAPQRMRGTDYISRMYATIRVCTGCGRYDGPWVPALD